jgi:GTP:adenosylcobinamide-phosphate guanylyltransferase
MRAEPQFNAIVLAADRGPGDPVAAAAGVPAKCLTPVAGSPMVSRVVRALRQSARVDCILLCGPAPEVLRDSLELRELIDGKRVRWISPQGSPSASAAAALADLAEDRPVLLTTCDHALLRPEIVRHFLDGSAAGGFDVAVGLAPHEIVAKAYPATRRTVLRFREGGYCGCNLFAFLSPRGRAMARQWMKVENQRKKPIRVIGLIGWYAMLLYALGRLSLADAVRRISAQTGLAAGAVVLPFAEAAIDVDSAADLELAREIAERLG